MGHRLLATTGMAATLARVRSLLAITFAVLAITGWPTATIGQEPDGAARECVRPDGVQRLLFSATEYPNIRRHFRRAVARRGWPLRLVVNRRGADERRERLLRDVPIRDDFDRDEYPPAVGRGRGRAWSAGAIRAAGSQTYGTSPVRRIGPTARRSARSSSGSATAPGSATYSASSAGRRDPVAGHPRRRSGPRLCKALGDGRRLGSSATSKGAAAHRSTTPGSAARIRGMKLLVEGSG